MTPCYGYDAELKNAIDCLHAEWRYEPVGTVSHGGVPAGTRAAQMIKQVVTALEMTPVSEAGAPAADAHVVEGRGRFVVPGFMDMHLHALNTPEDVDGTYDRRKAEDLATLFVERTTWQCPRP
ncbi:NAD(P)H-dependent oxidoreductase [Streptomyces sp. NPDC000963]